MKTKPKKCYTVKCRLTTVAYTDIYLYATSKTQAKAKAKAFMNHDDDTDIFDSSGTYGVEESMRNGIVESITCDENDILEVA